MTKYFTQFDESTQTIGTNLAGWTVRGGGAPTRAPAYGDPAVIPVKRRYLPFTTDSTSDYRCISWDAIDADANRAKANLVAAFTVDLATVEELHLYARGAGSVTDFYRLRIKLTGASNVNFDKLTASIFYTPGVASATVTLAAGKSYFVRFNVNGTTIQARLWDAALGMAGEPTTWDINTTDASISAAGWVGIGGRHTTLTGKIAPFNFFAVGTNGDSAVCPRTNTEYTAWLASQNALRTVLAELSATGYDSSGSPYTKTVNWYISNHGYTSQQQDTPSGKHYEAAITSIPTFRREMSSALSGAAQTGFGDLVVANAAAIVQGRTYMQLDGTSGCGASTPDSAAASVTGDIGLVVECALNDWSPGTTQMLLSKGVAGAVSFDWYVNTSGQMVLRISTDGTTLKTSSSAVMTVTDGTKKFLGVTRVAATGTPSFYTSDDGVAWTAVSTAVAGASGNIFDSSTVVTLGISSDLVSNPATGRFYRAKIFNSATLTGTPVVDYNLATVVKGATSFSGPQGEVWTINGTAKIRQGAETRPGTRDDLLRMRWNRNYLKLYLGDPSWPKHDFRLIVLGRLGMPTAPSEKEIRFPIADLSDALTSPMTATRFTSGDFNNKFKPRLFGNVRAIELQFNTSTLIAQINDGTLDSGLNASASYRLHDCTNVAFVHIGGTKGLTISSVDTATDTITASGTHNMSAGYRVVFTQGTPPAGLSLFTPYWVLAAGLTTTAFKVTATKGSTTPVDLTSAGSGTRKFNSFGYTFDVAAGTVELVAAPAGRVFCFQPGGDTFTKVSDLIASIAFESGGLSLNYKDAASFTAAAAVDNTDGAFCGLYTQIGELPKRLDLVAKAAGDLRAWYGFTPDGLMQTGSIALPAATAVQSFTESDIVLGSLKMVDVLRPINLSQANIGVGPWFNVGQPPIVPGVSLTTGDDYGETSAEIAAGMSVWTYVGYGAAGIPLDDHPDQLDSLQTAEANLVSRDGGELVTRLAVLRKHALGIFEFETRLPASQLNIGDTISLTYPRLGWKSYSASDPASPDNTATIDATKAVVIAIDTDLNRGRVRIKCFRRIPGYYPTADLN